MPVVIISPILDESMCKQIYIRLMTINARKVLEHKREHYWHGFEQGYVCFIVDMFGESNDDIYMKMANNNNSYPDVVEDMMEDAKFKRILESLTFSAGDYMASSNLDKLDEAVEDVVNRFANKNLQRMVDSIKYM